MVGLLTVLAAGLAAGAIHALSGPDHLAAVTPLSVSDHRRALRVGLLWGLGHAAGVAVIAVVLLLIRNLLDLDGLSRWSERAVGLMLIGVGVWGLGKAASRLVHTHDHHHGEAAHTHIHIHRPHPSKEITGHVHSHASLGVGLLHGVAGTSHLFGVLPALALPSRSAAGFYLLGYGLGNLVAMGGFAWLVGYASSRMKHIGARAYRVALGVCSIVSIGIGVVWLTF